MSEPDSLTTPKSSATKVNEVITCEMHLVEEGLWREFHSHHNEMIITKAGRCLFPLLRLASTPRPSIDPSSVYEERFDNPHHYLVINRNENYVIRVEMRAMDEMKWKWRQNQWTPILSSRSITFNAKNHMRPLECVYHGSILGADIVQNGLNFDKIKLSNRHHEDSMTTLKGGSIVMVLQSFQRYIPIVKISPTTTPTAEQTLVFDETAFLAVTHYQNEQITVLKKSYNPHAKGFVVAEEVHAPPLSSMRSWSVSPHADVSTDDSSNATSAQRTRKRIKPLKQNALTSESTTATVPSDEEELQGSLALHSLGT